MSSVTSITNNTTNQTSTNLTSALDNTLGKEDFLKLLIAQMKNQDPLNPVQNEEFVAQLAQFSSLEQMQNMNENLTKSTNSDLLMAQSISNSMLTNLIGKEVVLQTDSIQLAESGETEIGYRADKAAASAQVSIYDDSGNLVYYQDLGAVAAGEQSFVWDGSNTRGNRALAGNYKIKVELVNGDENKTTATTFTQGEVSAVKYNSDGATLLVNGQVYTVADVMEVRAKN